MAMNAYYVLTASDADSLSIYNNIRGAVYALGGTCHVQAPGQNNPKVHMALPAGTLPSAIVAPGFPSGFASGAGMYQYQSETIFATEGAKSSDTFPEQFAPELPVIETNTATGQV